MSPPSSKSSKKRPFFSSDVKRCVRLKDRSCFAGSDNKELKLMHTRAGHANASDDKEKLIQDIVALVT